MKTESIIIATATVATLVVTHIYAFLYTPPSTEKIIKTVFIPQGASFNLIARELEKEDVITDAGKFSLLAQFKDAITRIKAGEYEFTTSMPPTEVLEMMLSGQVKDYTITVPEGYSIEEVAMVLDNADIVKMSEFIVKAKDKVFAASLGIDGNTVEGYLFPDTYKLTKGMTPEEIIKRMVQRFNKVFSEVISTKSYGLNMSKRQIVTLASIIEKETGDRSESHIISAVFHNRIKKQMRLESDPTVIYGIKNFDGNLTKKHLLTHTPYNTYKVYGLPPGPIANPGRASLEAAVAPSPDPYLFFVSRNDGTHYFSRSLKEHNKAVRVYQKGFKRNQNQEIVKKN